MNDPTLSAPLFLAVAEHPWLTRLLLVSIEFALLAAAIWALIALLRLRQPRLVAVLLLIIMIKPLISLVIGPMLPVYSFESTHPSLPAAASSGILAAEQGDSVGKAPAPALPSQASPEQIITTAQPSPETKPQQPIQTEEQPGLPGLGLPGPLTLLFWAWLGGMTLCLSIAAINRYRVHRLIAAADTPPAALWGRYQAIADEMAIRTRPTLWITDALESPALAGSFAPSILIPRWMLDPNEDPKLDWALRHELTHWRLGDWWGQWLRQLVQVVFFFHPAAWWVGRRWEDAMEQACDRAVVKTSSQVADYSEQLYRILVEVRDRRRLALAGGMFATRSQIGRRISALLTEQTLKHPAFLRPSTRLSVLVLLILVTCLGIGIRPAETAPETPVNATEAIQLNEKGLGLWNLGEFQQAERFFHEAIDSNPDYAHAWSNLAWMRLLQNDLQAARDAFNRCLALDPQAVAALNGLATVCMRQDEPDRAVELWKQAIAIEPGASAPYAQLARHYLDTGQLADAEQTIRELVKLMPYDQTTEELLARYAGQSGRLLDVQFDPTQPKLDRWILGTEASQYAKEYYELPDERLVLKSLVDQPQGFGNVVRLLPAEPFKGSMIRFSGSIKTESVEGAAGLWARVDGPGREILAFDNMQDRPIRGTTPFADYSIQLPVPESASHISIGLLLVGTGQVELKEVRIQVVMPDEAQAAEQTDDLVEAFDPNTIDFSTVTEAYLSDIRDRAIAAERLNPAIHAEIARVKLRAYRNHPYKDKIDLRNIFDSLQARAVPQPDQIRQWLHQAQALGEQHPEDPDYAWRIPHLLATMALALGEHEQSGAYLDQAIDHYPAVQYIDPSRHSMFQHLVNQRAGLIWESEGVDAAERYLLGMIEDPRMDYVYDTWWQERYESAGMPERYEKFLERIHQTLEQR